MNQKNLRGVVLFTGLLLIVFWAVASSVNNIDAETNITPTLYVTDLSYLPYVRGLVAGPTASATLPPPTMTPYATNTNTPTDTSTPTATATNTPTPTATDTTPPVLTAPMLYDIENGDQDGNFTVAWLVVTGAYYQLMENHNDTGFAEIYIGYGLSVDRSDMAPGEYCYNVRARANDQWSAWSGEKCTTVVSSPILTPPTLYDIDNSDQDGNYTVSWSSVAGATRYFVQEEFNNISWKTIYDGPALSIDRSGMAPGDYCYNVRAYGPAGRSEWTGEKCTLVVAVPECQQVLVNPQLDFVELSPGRGTVDPWFFMDPIIYFVKEGDGSGIAYDGYSLVLPDGDEEDPTPKSDILSQIVQFGNNLQSVTITYQRAMLDPNPTDQVYGELWSLTDDGEVDLENPGQYRVTRWQVTDSKDAWNEQVVELDKDLFNDLNGQEIALLLRTETDGGGASPAEEEWVFFDDVTMTACKMPSSAAPRDW